MKKIITTLFTLISMTIFSQTAMTFAQADANGVRVAQLDSIYPGGLHADSTKAVFWDREEEFIASYKMMLQDLGNYLKANKFSWDKETRCFNRIYLNKDGHVDYFIYSFSKGAITPEKEKQFDILLNRFIKEYKFPMRANTGFAQCSPVRYND